MVVNVPKGIQSKDCVVLLGVFLEGLYWPNNLLLHLRPGLCCAHSSSTLEARAGAGAEMGPWPPMGEAGPGFGEFWP